MSKNQIWNGKSNSVGAVSLRFVVCEISLPIPISDDFRYNTPKHRSEQQPRQFRREWFRDDGLFPRKNIPSSTNPENLLWSLPCIHFLSSIKGKYWSKKDKCRCCWELTFSFMHCLLDPKNKVSGSFIKVFGAASQLMSVCICWSVISGRSLLSCFFGRIDGSFDEFNPPSHRLYNRLLLLFCFMWFWWFDLTFIDCPSWSESNWKNVIL